MRVWVSGGKIRLLGSVLLLGIPLGSQVAEAKSSAHASSHGSAAVHHGSETAHGGGFSRQAGVMTGSSHARQMHGGSKHEMYASRRGGKAMLRYASMGGRSGGISCVPYAREVSGIALTGNAATWWDEASGVYARGNAPESGSVLNFRANSSMHLGHVAVVSNVVNAREIEIDHANWSGPGASKGGISRNISVVDVSPNNDWTAVRVGLGHTGDYGSIYPTYGFIYDRQEGSASHARMISASITPPPSLNQAPRDLRPMAQRIASRKSYDEVAEAPTGRGIDLNVGRLTLDAPDRSVR